MLHRRFLAIAAVSASVIAGASLVRPATAAQTLDCWMNDSKQTCQVKPWGNGGFEISFSGSAIYRFVPAGPPTTDNRRMRDEQGRIWLMSGHHSFTLSEQNGDGNRIAVSNVKSRPAAAADHQAHSKVKLSGHGQPTVTLYAKPNYGAAIAGMGVSGETLDKLACTSNSQGTWCRVGYPGQSGRVLWVNRDSLIFLGDGE
ncbi:hypothetical protein [Cyanobium gracile]|jgi:hypothetical protein|uniref:SH3b domain-containing protein n=1 Tax=Cyanobium gracile UHCC 0281 TaxID=3110309 RepID=A0ABU5SXS3_9CYAN|nr:hypothetical protein [Cyanobium gracile]MEA5443223.1 hypothetical protein [Cyanobium gracile UHCC 0281]